MTFNLETLGNLSFLDMTVIIIFAFCIITGYFKGLVLTIFDLLSMFIAFFITGKLYPYANILMRVKGGPYDMLKKHVVESLNLGQLVNEGAEKAIEALYYPDFIKNKLSDFNTPDIYNLLGVSAIEEYISSYIANILINIITSLTVFLLVMLIMKLIAKTLDIVTKLPVINTFNKAGGALVGALTGLLFTWIFMGIYTLFYIGRGSAVWDNINDSLISGFFYEHNLVLDFLLKTFSLRG